MYVDTPTIERQIQSYKDKLVPYIGDTDHHFVQESSFKNKALRFISDKKIYIGIWFLVLLVFVVWQPSFIYVVRVEDEEEYQILSFKKLFLYWVVISSILSGCYYAYIKRSYNK